MEIRRFGRVGALVVAASLLGGCALPIPLQIASWALDGVSYVVTRKSVADHGISLALNQDCAVFRAVTEGGVCREDSEFQITFHATDAPVPESGVESKEEFSADLTPVALTEPTAAAAELVELTDERSDRFFVIGSFASRDNAVRLARAHVELDVSVMPLHVGNKEIFRVLVGPFQREAMREAGLTLKRHGIRNAWGLRVDPDQWRSAKLDPRDGMPVEDGMNLAAIGD